MRCEQIQDPVLFQERAGVLLADEARHNLMLGILGTLIVSPEVYPEYRLFLISDDAGPQCAAVITPPYNLIISDTPNVAALPALVEAAITDGIEIPGAIGNQPTIDHFADKWRRATTTHPNLEMEQGVFALEKVNEVAGGSGQSRPATTGDEALLTRWMRAFLTEALPNEPYHEERNRGMLQRRLSGGTPNAYWLWEDKGEVVSWSGHGNPTGRGIRIGPVYTPPEFRGRGYATALVAAESQWLLDNGYDMCFLYTDLANPTSNAIYERIGYHKIAESAVYGFVTPASRAT